MATPEPRIEAATLEHVEAFVDVLRPECIREAEALGYEHHMDGLLDCFDGSEACYSIFFGDNLAFMCGRCPAPESRVAMAWCLTSEAVRKHPKAFLRASPLALELLFEDRDALYNLVDARNLDTVRWAKWLGFEVAPAGPYGPHGLPFHLVTMRREHVL